MERHEAGEMVRYVGRLFPRWKTTPELMELWGQMFLAYPVKTARAVLNSHRANRASEDPDLKAVKEALGAWREANPIVAADRRLTTSPGRSAVERCERYFVGGREAWILDGFEERHWWAMEAEIAEWKLTGKASHWRMVRRIVRGQEHKRLGL